MKPKPLRDIIQLSLFAILTHSSFLAQTQSLHTVEFSSGGEVASGKAGEDWQVYQDHGRASNFFVKFDGSADFLFSMGRGFWITSQRIHFGAELSESIFERSEIPRS